MFSNAEVPCTSFLANKQIAKTKPKPSIINDALSSHKQTLLPQIISFRAFHIPINNLTLLEAITYNQGQPFQNLIPPNKCIIAR